MKISIIIPAYNEESRIRETLALYLPYFSRGQKDVEFIIVVEGDDRTRDIINSFQKNYKGVRCEYSKERLGKGGAIIRGFGLATGDFVGYVDADASTLPEAFDDLIKNINNYDGVIASRKVHGAILIEKEPLLQRLGSRGFNILVRSLLFLPFKDTQCGAKLFRRGAINSVLPELGVTEFGFDVDLLFRLRKKDFAIKEVPTIWKYKAGTKFNFDKWFWKLIPSMLLSLFRLRLLHSPFKDAVRAYDATRDFIRRQI